MRHFIEQTELIRAIYQIKPGEVDLPTFPLFALFDPALGMTTVIPMMNATKPAKANPQILSATIDAFGVTNMFGSPALLNTLSRFCDQTERRLPSLRRVISAGAAVPSDTIERLKRWLTPAAAIHTPYGATECLPVATANDELLTGEARRRTTDGGGFVSRVVPPNLVRIIKITDDVLETCQMSTNSRQPRSVRLPAGPTTTQRYFARDGQTSWRVKMMSWVCGFTVWAWVISMMRAYFGFVVVRSIASSAPTNLLFCTDQSVFNTHPNVYRTALVSLGSGPQCVPGLCVELEGDTTRD